MIDNIEILWYTDIGQRCRLHWKKGGEYMENNSAKDLLWNLVKCYEREEILNQRIAGIERMRNYINYVSQGHEKDCEKVREQMEKKKRKEKAAIVWFIIMVAADAITFLFSFLQDHVLVNFDVQNESLHYVLIIAAALSMIICPLGIAAPIIAIVLLIKASGFGGQANKLQRNIDAYMLTEKQYASEHTEYYNDAINGVDIRPLEAELERDSAQKYSLMRFLEKEAHMSLSYIHDVNSAKSVWSNAFRYDVGVAEAYLMYKREMDRYAEIEEHAKQRELEERRHRETQQQIQSLQDSIEQSNQDAEKRYRDAQFREDMRDIIYRRH